MDIKIKTARLSIFSNIFLIIIKIFAGILSGSVSILSEAIHSGIDLIASAIAFFAVKISSRAPDKRHPYGHGKFENISGVIEGLLIFIAAFWIIFESVNKIIHPSDIKFFEIAASVMFISAIINYFVSEKLYKVAADTDSIALKADALHLRTDVYSSVGVGIGMIVIWATGWHFFDPIFGIIVALFIMKEAYSLVKDAFDPLLDSQVSNTEYIELSKMLDKITADENVSYKDLRSRTSGATHLIDFILLVDEDMSVKDSHKICDILEKKLESIYRATDISIHVEPLTK